MKSLFIYLMVATLALEILRLKCLAGSPIMYMGNIEDMKAGTLYNYKCLLTYQCEAIIQLLSRPQGIENQ